MLDYDALHELLMNRFLQGPQPASVIVAPGELPDMSAATIVAPPAPGTGIKLVENAFCPPGYAVVLDRYGTIIQIFRTTPESPPDAP